VGGIVRLPEIQRPIVVPDTLEDEAASVSGWPVPCTGGGKSECSNKVAPAVLAQAYNYTPVATAANGSIFATAEFQGQKWDQKHMDVFATACTPGFTHTVAKDIGRGDDGKGVESLLDVEYASGVAGNIPLWNIYSKTYSLEDYVKTLAAQADGAIPLINSVSYGNDEIQQSSTAYMEACNAQFMGIGARGVSILFASGDQGVWGRSGQKGKVFHPDFPAGSPYITSVGGTDFSAKGVIGAETAWGSGR
jgi:tripeptidyl-peptidase-1